MTGQSAPLVDSHAHVFHRRIPFVRDAWTVPDYDFTAEDLLAMLDEHGVERAVVSGFSIAGTWNEYTLEVLRAHDRLRGTAILSPGTPRAEIDRLAAGGVVGLRLQLARMEPLPDLRSDAYRELFGHARDAGWHVQLAIEGPRLRPVLEALAESGIAVVIDHFGHPDPAGPLACDGFAAMLEAVDSGRAWVKRSGGFRLAGTAAWQDGNSDLEQTAQTVAAALLARVGTERLLWGSDAPFVGYEKRLSYPDVLRTYRSWVPDAAHRAEIDRTALKLYFA